MKKSVQKLTLHRETLRRLSSDPLKEVAGGVPDTVNRSCLLSCFGGCSAVGCTDGCPSHILPTGCGVLTDCIQECL